MDTPDTLINQLITEGALNVTVLNNVSNVLSAHSHLN